jgi:glyoxylase-like metal-dependent hydrolase (beta-lactamase superfamily II)/ferredoxin
LNALFFTLLLFSHAMADVRKKYAENVDGLFFVDRSCINCDTCQQLAPHVFAEHHGEHSYVFAQPTTAEDTLSALQALIACPTSSIGTTEKLNILSALDSFPMPLEDGVYYCGFTSSDSFGASSYYIQRSHGNWLIDSPRFTPHLVRKFEQLGGIAHIFLTHRDDVADAARYAAHFGAIRHIHERDAAAQPDSEHIFKGDFPIQLDDDLLIIPTPGHTAGHSVLLYAKTFLFSGDHLWWSPMRQALSASRSLCWYSWSAQIASMEMLLSYSFEWILPGHGARKKMTPDAIQASLHQLITRMKTLS